MALLLPHNEYLDYQSLTSALTLFKDKFPDFIDLSSLGQSKEGREYWLLTLTDKKTRKPECKPAYWIDGNTHASELSGTQACLFLIDKLLCEKDSVLKISKLLEDFTIYAFPRISVDGAEYVLKSGQLLRSSLEPFPEKAPHERFEPKDMDGDNEISQMRVLDSAGQFKISKKDPRLMIPREPWDDDSEGPFYHLITEGEYLNFDGFSKNSFTKFGFDLNRQSPTAFSPNQAGAGPIPMHLNEAKVYAKAIVDRPNIFAINTYHTYGGVLLRPSSLRADSELNTMDLEIFKKIGEMGETQTGYKACSVFHDFKYDPKSVMTGAWADWHYDHRGIFSQTPEIWNLAKMAGVEVLKPLDIYRNLGETELLKIISWCDAHLDPLTYFKDWKRYQHSQLGEIEIGGFKQLFVISNPPRKWLKAEVEKLAEFSIKQILMGPQIEITKAEVKSIGPILFQLSLEIKNKGFLPTYFSEQRKTLNIYKTPSASLSLAPNQVLIQGKMETPLEHLLGRSRNIIAPSSIWADASSNPHEVELRWMVQGKGKIDIQIDYAGSAMLSASFDCQ